MEKVAYGMTEEDILSEWHYLAPIQVRSCSAYAAGGHLIKTLYPVRLAG